MNLFKRIGCIMLGAAISITSFGVISVQGASATTIRVAKSGGDFTTISDALKSIDFVPTKTKPVNIVIDKGVYEETFTVDKPYISFINNGKAEDVVITYDKSVGHADMSKRAGTEKTATVAVDAAATGFKAVNITFQNSYNLTQEEEYSQAVAVVTNADQVKFDGCRFIGRQDTLYLKGASKGADVVGSANPSRVLVKDSYIEGTVDFIFGDATAVFENCDINMAYRQGGGYFTAPNTTLYNIGYVFDKCRFTVDKKYTAEEAANIYLGRPWQCDSDHPNFGSETVIMNSELPEILNPQGFSLWDSTSQINKVRFYEYNNKVEGAAIDTSKRADFVNIMNEAQAEGFKPYNVLRGSDMWNPGNFESVANTPAAEVTLGEYDISIPKNETKKLAFYPLPMGAKSDVSFVSSNTDVAEIGSDGVINAKETGKAAITASLENGTKVSANVTVTAARTAPPTVSEINIQTGSSLDPGDRLRGSYSLALSEDAAADNSLIRWIAVDGITGEEYILSEGRGSDFLEYVVTDREIGSYIKLEVVPESLTSYGAVGESAAFTTPTVVTGEDSSILKDGFSAISDMWETGGNPSIIAGNNNSFVTGGSETNTTPDRLIYKDSAINGNYTAVLRERFNPEVDGLSGDSYEDIFLNYTDSNNYYKVRITRGGNTKSLRMYIIKSLNGTEETLASDESSMKDNVYQNSGENNPYFRIVINKSQNTVTAGLVLEEGQKVLTTLTADYDDSLSGGSFGIEAYGKKNGILIDYVNIFGESSEVKEPATRIFIAGDSTAKNYGDDNTIGGWGEYIPYYFSDDVEIINKAEGGRSSRSFINQGRLDEICKEAHKGDYVFIQFGINDGQTDDNYRLEYMTALGEPDANGNYPYIQPVKVSTPQVLLDCYKDTGYPYGDTYYPYEGGTFKWYLKQYVDRVRETGATPVLMTSICRVFFDADGKITPHYGENDGYIKAVLQVAEELDCEVIDFYEITKDLYESYGYSMVQGLTNVKADGSMDLTHYNKFGANIIASKFAQAVKEAGLGLESYVTPSRADVERTDGLKSADLILVGDEFVGDYSADDNKNIIPVSGISKYIPEYMSTLINVIPMGEAGASAKSYAESDKYNTFLNTVNEGDYVVIHFGTNDSETGDKYAVPTGDKDTEGSFAYYLYNYYIKPVKDKKAVPILLTPMALYNFDGGEYTYDDGGYTEAVRALAADQQNFFCNMTDNMSAIYKEAGEEKGRIYNAVGEEGLLTHYLSDIGARKAALSFLNSMKFSSSTFKDYVKLPEEDEVFYITKGSFAELLVNASGLTGTGYFKFADMPMGRSYVNACNLLKEYNIAKGDENNCFYPENLLTRQNYNQLINNTAKSLKLDYSAVTDTAAGQSDDDFITVEEARAGVLDLCFARIGDTK